MAGISEGSRQEQRSISHPMYLGTGDPGPSGGGTYSNMGQSSSNPNETTMQQYENIFGPAARDIKLDSQRHKRHQRWHLPDALKGSNQYLTDRVDGLITDATNSPFTRNILPYVYLENPDQKLKWNVYSFDEGIASRVPYESAARVLPQSKRSFAGYTVRQGLAIAMEHNFMASAAGRENFKNQLTQLVGSIQMTNDLDVHVALLQAPSYQKHMDEKYFDQQKTTAQNCRQYVDLFGMLQKVPNALDILIEDAKNHLQTWGSQPPTFLLCNGALTAQLTMLPEKTNYLTNGVDGLKRLAQGPELSTYRGLQIIHSRKFSMDAGTTPRDLMRRRVRVAEYHRIPWDPKNRGRTYEFYDQSRDTMFRLTWEQLCEMAQMQSMGMNDDGDDADVHPGLDNPYWRISGGEETPEDFHFEDWDGSDKIGGPPVRLRLKSSGDAILEQGGSIEISGIPSLAHALGLGPVANYPSTALHWPHSVQSNTIGKTRKRKLNDLMQKIDPDDMQGSLSTEVVFHQMPDQFAGKYHHRQSEAFGAGIYNDPIINIKDDATILCNWNGLTKDNDSIAKAVHVFNVVTLFELMLKALGVDVLEYHLATATVRPTPGENADFARAAVDAGVPEAKLNAFPLKDPVTPVNNYDEITADATVIMNKIRELAGPEGGQYQEEYARMGMDPINPKTAAFESALRAMNHDIEELRGEDGGAGMEQAQAQAANLLGGVLNTIQPADKTTVFQHVAASILEYLKTLNDWRKECFVDNVKYHAQYNRLNTKSCGGHDLFKSLRYGLWTTAIATIIDKTINWQPSLPASDDVQAMITCIANNSVAALITHNVMNRGNKNCILQPNLHITRCADLSENDVENSASSLRPSEWLLQQLACMMPLSHKMCQALLAQAPFKMIKAKTSKIPDHWPLINEYMQLLNGKAKSDDFTKSFVGKLMATVQQMGVGDDDLVSHVNAYLEPHNTVLMHWFMSEFHPNAVIRDVARKKSGVESEEMMAFMAEMGAALRSNTLYTSGMDSKMEALVSARHTPAENIYYNPSPAAKSYSAIDLYSNYDNLTLHTNHWDRMPVDNSKVSADFEGQYFDIKTQNLDKTDPAKSVKNKHPWTSDVVESLSSLHFPLDVKYKPDTYDPVMATKQQKIYDSNSSSLRDAAEMASNYCTYSPNEAARHVVMNLFHRFYKPTVRFMNKGAGVPVHSGKNYAFAGCHPMHGPELPTIHNDGGVGGGAGGAQDILILRPNIEHEMLGIIMGRGGTQELGATFWGQTELSCYDDSQHGIWGMSYKYHERAIVTNERNMIRVWDVAFDGYNGGMDQEHVDWNDAASIADFREKTYQRNVPYHGASMLVMGLPHDRVKSHKSWPNPIMFHPNQQGSLTQSPEGGPSPSDAMKHMVFAADTHTSGPQRNKYKEYMHKLGLEYWTTADIQNKPAGESAIGNESSTNAAAFEGTMKVYDANGSLIESTQGSGHLGPSYVGVASIREGRGVLNPAAAPMLGRMI